MPTIQKEMRLHRFYIAEQIGVKSELVIISAEIANQVRRVFRLKIGDSIIVFDGSGYDYTCRIKGFDKNNTVTLSIIESNRSRYMPEREVILCAAIVKKDTFEWIVEKASEMGVIRIVPLLTERSEKKSLNMKRLERIAIEASEQSGRGNIPVIDPIHSLRDIIETHSRGFGQNIDMMAFHIEGKPLIKADLNKNNIISIFIGPEGGWSPDETELFHKNNVSVYCLGPQVLRAETAVIAALSQIVF